MTKKRIENIKTILLVVLFLMTILLLYLLWTGDSKQNFTMDGVLNTGEINIKVPHVTEVLRPEYVAFGQQDGSFLLAEGDITSLQDRTMELIKSAMENSDAVVSPITEEQFFAAISGYCSMVIKTCADLPMSDYLELLGFNHADSLNSVSHVSEFAFSDASRESMFIYDAVVNKYYRILFEEEGDFVNTIKGYAKLSENLYYLTSSILGGGSDALIPLEDSCNISFTDFENEYESGGRDKRIEMAEAVFGENFDFVRRITDNFGNITYMYGYGQKVFTANTDGSFTYSCEKTNTYSKGFFSDLELALEFASACGGWIYDEGISALALSGYKDEGRGRATNRTFYFTQYVSGYEICNDDSYALSVYVESGQVTEARRCISIVTGAAHSSLLDDPVDAPNVIAQNCNHIYNILNNNTLAAATDDAFNYASDAIKSIKIAFYRGSGDRFLTPCWKVEAAEVSFYFDLRTASPLGFSK